MKKLHLLVLKTFIGPFVLTFFIVLFVLLLFFLFKYIDDLVGKNFEWPIIAKLLLYVSATNASMALPLAILFSSIMTYGSLGEHYELVAIKSVGISIVRAIYPMIIVVILLSVAAFLFSDYMLPITSLKFYSLLHDARHQKPGFLIREGVFNNSFPGYTIRVQKQGKDGQTLYGILIYQQNEKTGNRSVLLAKEGKMFKTVNNQFLVLKLKDGVRYEESPGDTNANPRQKLIRFRFQVMEQRLDLSVFKLKRTEESDFRHNPEVMNLKQLTCAIDSLRRYNDTLGAMNFRMLSSYIYYFSLDHRSPFGKNIGPYKHNTLSTMTSAEKKSAVLFALREAQLIKEMIVAQVSTDQGALIRRFIVNYQKKFVLAANCLVLFLIGAPLGAIIRKGGLGLSLVVCLLCFLSLHVIGTIGEKSVKEGSIDPILGMWLVVILFFPLGIFLSYKAATDSTIFDVEWYKNFLVKNTHKRSYIKTH